MKIVLFTLFLINISMAHKLNVFLYEEKEKNYISSYFASGSTCKNCKVEIFNKEGKLIESSNTDKNGEYIIIQNLSSLKVRVEAVGGHAVEKVFELKNIETKENIEKEKSVNSLLQSLVSIILIALIFLFLKRIKK